MSLRQSLGILIPNAGENVVENDKEFGPNQYTLLAYDHTI